MITALILSIPATALVGLAYRVAVDAALWLVTHREINDIAAALSWARQNSTEVLP